MEMSLGGDAEAFEGNRLRDGLIAGSLCVLLGLIATDLRAEAPPPPLGTLFDAVAIDSPALGRPLTGAVYLPAGSAIGEASSRLPVVYLLHGTNSQGMDWVREALLPQAMDALIAAGAIRPMIAVMPDAGNSWYADSAAVAGPGDYATAISRDLAVGVERRFPALTTREGRALIGISMGGHGALGMAFGQPERYVAAVSLSGAFWNRTDQTQVPADRIQRIFQGSFGQPFDRARFREASPFTRIARLKESGLPLAIRLVTGDRERFNTLGEAIDLLTELRQSGSDAELRVIGGGHDWANWAQALPDALVFVDRAFHGAGKATP
jgi:enterochelin esterase family protein